MLSRLDKQRDVLSRLDKQRAHAGENVVPRCALSLDNVTQEGKSLQLHMA